MKLFKNSEMDLTSGNLFWKMPLFVVPLIITNVLQLLYTTIDLWTVSKFGGGSTSMAAIGTNSALINLIITVLVSLATGANVCISTAKGSGDKDRAQRILNTAMLVALIGGIAVGLFGFFTARTLLEWMDTPASMIDNAAIYLKVYFLGVPLLMIYNFGSQILRALGDSKTPLIILALSGIFNVVFDIVLVYYFNMDVLGVAIATVISEGISAILTTLWFVFSKSIFVKIDFKNMRIDKLAAKDIFRIGIPAGIQGLAFCIPNVMIQSSLYTITDYSIDGVAISQDEIVAGAAASAQIEGYVFQFLDAWAVGIISFVGQNYGASNTKNIRKCYWFAVVWMLIAWGLSVAVCSIFPNQLLSIFIEDGGGIVADNALAAGKERMFMLLFTYFLDGWMDINGNYLRGMKRSNPPAILTLIGCTGTRIIFLLTLFKMPYFHTIFWLYAAFPISWVLVNLVYIPMVLILEKKTLKPLEEAALQ